MFIFPLADACFRESFPTSVANGNIVCTSGNIRCTVTCDSGYIFNDGNKTKIYDCPSTNVWTPTCYAHLIRYLRLHFSKVNLASHFRNYCILGNYFFIRIIPKQDSQHLLKLWYLCPREIDLSFNKLCDLGTLNFKSFFADVKMNKKFTGMT
jgi:hypothetical protein